MKTCQFCTMAGKDREDGVYICDACWKLLQEPTTAMALIRGHLTMELRGKMPEEDLKKHIDKFMEMVSTWKRPG